MLQLCTCGAGRDRHTHLLLSKVILTQRLPQPPVLAERAQHGAHLAQGHDVPAIGEPVQDVVEHVQGQVTEREALVHLRERGQDPRPPQAPES